jgi:hypothetical protein
MLCHYKASLPATPPAVSNAGVDTRPSGPASLAFKYAFTPK